MSKLDILQHTLGVNQYGQGSQYRNHFCAGEGHSDYATLTDLVAEGLMVKHAPREISGGDFIFRATDAGKEWMSRNSPAPPNLTRSQKRYRRYLNADSGFTFREWLNSPEAKAS